MIGRLADRRGRKPAMILSFTLMGIAIAGLALTPSYALIGMAAPVLAVLFRLIQGFALGGEVGPNAAFLLEAAPPHRRALLRLDARGDGGRGGPGCRPDRPRPFLLAQPGRARRLGLARRLPDRRVDRAVRAGAAPHPRGDPGRRGAEPEAPGRRPASSR